jgi:dipeptidyl-peptidase-4
VDTDGGGVTWLELPGDPRSHYVNSFEWAPGGDELFVQQLNRPQNTVRLFMVDPKVGTLEEIMVEREETWLDLRPVQWVEGGQAFLWESERDGWRHVYRIERSGGHARLLTSGTFDILSVEAVDEVGGWLYFLASPDDPGQRYLFRTTLDGTGDLDRITPQNAEGTHDYDIAPGARWAWHTESAIDSPPVTRLISLPDHNPVRVEVDNAPLKAKLAALDIRPTEFFRVDIGKGVQLDGWVMKPSDFDPTRRYPVLFYVYGMPARQPVLDAWGGDRHLFHHLLTQRGYVVMSVDNRGTPAPRGRDFRRFIYLRHGVLPAQDQAAAVRALEAQWPWMDPSRMGIYGWSGGGNVSMNAIFRHPDVYSTAMPGAGLSHHRYYHAAFTERFLGLPQENPEAYEATAPVNVAKNLRGNLIIIHGTGDPNVHYQSAEALANALIAAKKRFTIMPYPNQPHVFPDQYHLYDLYLWFLVENMPAGAGGSDGPSGRGSPW